MSSSSSTAVHENWSKCLIFILWAACAVFLLICFYQTIKEVCFNLYQGSTQIFRGRTRRRQHHNHHHQAETVGHDPSVQSESRGLASAFIQSLPSVQFSGEIKGGNNYGNTECSVCLSEFLEGQWLRLLPNCGHVFHATCIDTWFSSHSTCPVCRTSVLHGFNVCNSSGPSLSLMHALPREDIMNQEMCPTFWLESIAQFEDMSANSESRTEGTRRSISSSTYSDVFQ